MFHLEKFKADGTLEKDHVHISFELAEPLQIQKSTMEN